MFRKYKSINCAFVTDDVNTKYIFANFICSQLLFMDCVFCFYCMVPVKGNCHIKIFKFYTILFHVMFFSHKEDEMKRQVPCKYFLFLLSRIEQT